MITLLMFITGGTCGYLMTQAINRRDFLLGFVTFNLYYFVGIVGMVAVFYPF